MRFNVRFAGLGGQGIITMGLAIGRASSIYDKKYVIMTEAYGPEITGGFARADVIISDEEIDYPLIEHPDILVLMHTDGWERNKDLVTNDSLVIYDDFLAKVEESGNGQFFKIPSFSVGNELGRKVVANVVMMGAIQEITKIVSKEALRKALLDLVPKGTEELNLTALERGYEIGSKIGGKIEA